MSKMFGVRRGLIEVCEGMDYYLVKKEGKGKIRQIIPKKKEKKFLEVTYLICSIKICNRKKTGGHFMFVCHLLNE